MSRSSELRRICFYGKGGVGKSTVSTNVSAALAQRGRRVLHVGCDPKHDSTVALMDGRLIPTVLERSFSDVVTAEQVVHVSRLGVHCVESGGPDAGVGCAGRGISRTLEILDLAGLLQPDRYDVAVFDVLGDVVCGGFAAPLRRGVGDRVVIVACEEVMALYAANNIARAVLTYAYNGISCAGLVLDVRDRDADLEPARRFAALLGVPILATIPRDPMVREAEYRQRTVIEHAPDSPAAKAFAALAELLVSGALDAAGLPAPLTDAQFHEAAAHRFEWETPAGEAAPTAAPAENCCGDSELERRRHSYQHDLRAGITAVQRELVDADDALVRLKRRYPEFTGALTARDLER